MFDYQVSKHPHFDEACRAFALRHNLVQLAERAGMNVQILRNKLNPAQPHLLTAPEIWLLTDLTEDSTLVTAVRGRWPGVYREQTEMKKKLISGLFLMLWMALLIAAMVYPQGIFPVLAASGVWVACLLTWAVIPVALAALIQNGPLWQELRASLLKTITRKEYVFISWVMRLLIVVSLAWTGWAITLVFYLLTVIAFWITRNQMAQ
ncbi:DNZ54_00345 family protein [Escherichia coli]|uniref:DNZ54_00345 family protein n=8 Tax=Enterobacteriaceae TaxID=543 RepID=UPI0012FD286C|nr:hypothetical protein F6P95_18940 [Escherichia coli]